jgi:glycosyltransferase involved in cell wall biosynthesis
MKILMLGWELPPHNSGGLGVACLQLSKALARAGADINFVLPYRHSHRYDFMEVWSAVDINPGSTVLAGAYDSRSYMNDSSPERLDINDQQWLYAMNVARLAERLEFDVIHAHDWLTFRAALLAKQIKSRPLVLHVHSIERDRSGGGHGNPWVREIEETSMLMADHIYAVSQRTKQMIVDDYGIPASKIDVAHNSIDPSVFEELSPENDYRYLYDLKQDGWRVVVNVGRLTIQKGLPHLLEAARLVVQKEPKTLFLFVGDGEQRDELIEMAVDKRIGKNVIFAGFQRGKRWRDAYSIADIFVMPSVSEPFGLTPVEAAAYGTPSIVSWQSGVSEIFKNCLKVDYWDTELMADKLVGALRSQAFLDELGNNSRREISNYNWGGTAAKIMSKYESFAGASA